MRDTPPVAELSSRLAGFREELKQRKLPAALVTNERNVRYLSGFPGSESALLITRDKKFLLTDFRYMEEARRDLPAWSVVVERVARTRDGKEKELIPRALMDKAGYLAQKLRLRTLAVEAEDMRVVDMRALRKAARNTRLKPLDKLLCGLRLFKSAWEVQQIEKALRIQERCFLELFASLEEGTTERGAAVKLRYMMVRAGADDQAFEPLFQVGSHSSQPHGRAGSRVLDGDAIVLVDWGAKKAGYHSDLTRTFFLGTIPERLRKIHDVVVDAQGGAINRIAPGVSFAEVDGAAREVIRKAGYGKAFGHSTGHGLGLDVHEPPALSAREKGEFDAGMVVTVEPGVYFPGLGGVRIEDDVLVTPGGHRVLSRLQRSLRWNGL